MQYPKLPGNVYSYRSTIFGIPIRDALLICIIASISILAVKISVFIPTIAAILAIVIFLYSRKGKTVDLGRKLDLRGKRFKVLFPVSVKSYNGHTFILSGRQVSLFLKISSLNILAMRTASQKSATEGLRAAVEDAGVDMDFFSIHGEQQDKRGGPLIYTTYARFSTRRENNTPLERTFTEVSDTTSSFQSSIAMIGLRSREMDDAEEIGNLINSLMH